MSELVNEASDAECILATKKETALQIDERADGSVVVTILARNPVIAALATLLAGLPAFACLLLALIGIYNGAFETSLMFVAFGAGFVWLAWRFGWQKKSYQINFDQHGFRSGPNSFAYSEIAEFVVDLNGGAPFDPGSMPVPRNTTPGHHVSVRVSGQLIPITTGLKRQQAQQLRDACITLFERFANGRPD